MLPRARIGLFMAGPVLAFVGIFMVGTPGIPIGLAVGVALYLWSNGWGCTIEEDAIVIDSVRKKRIPWANVQAISYSISRFSTAATIVDNSGKTWILRAPTHSSFAPDPLLRAKMTDIENFWKIQRGSQWQESSELTSGLPIWQRTS